MSVKSASRPRPWFGTSGRGCIEMSHPTCGSIVLRQRTTSTFAADIERPASEGLDQAAVDDEVGPGHVAGAVPGQQHDEVGDLLRLGEAAGGRSSRLLGGDVLRIAALRRGHRGGYAVVAQPEAGRDGAGADRVDPDPARADL